MSSAGCSELLASWVAWRASHQAFGLVTATACSGKLGVSSQTWTGSQQWAVWWCCHLEQLWCPTVPEALAACITATILMTLAFVLSWLSQVTFAVRGMHGVSLLSPTSVWHCNLCCRMRSPEDRSQLQRQIWWAGNGNKLSRQDALPTGPVISWTHYPRNFKVSNDLTILFWYHHHDRFKWVSYPHAFYMYMHTQIAWWVIWKTLPRLLKLGLLLLHEK